MNEIYNEEYYRCCCGPIPYEEPEHWMEFFGGVADKIVKDIHPKTVLDAGCAMGYLVAALRDRGVEAYGIDISEYALSRVREDIRPYCALGSLTEPLPASLPARYDLVVTIEVLEHLYASDGEKAIKNICTWTDRVIFSSTPDDITEKTHVNVQQREYWARRFAREGFFDDLSYRPIYLTAYAVCFRKSGEWLRQVEDYERNMRLSEAAFAQNTRNWEKAVEDKERHIQNLTAAREAERSQWNEAAKEYKAALGRYEAELEGVRGDLAKAQELAKRERCGRERAQRELTEARDEAKKALTQAEERAAKERERLTNELAHYKLHYQAAINQREELKVQLAQVKGAYDAISQAACWRMTKPLRAILDAIKTVLGKSRMLTLCGKGLRCWRENGFSYTWAKLRDRSSHRQSYTAVTRPLFSADELERQREEKFPREIKFSILVPLYNTPERFLHEMIRSVLDQTYTGWELCLADGSDPAHADVERICRQYAKKDGRIKYRRLGKNLGISGNTNACIEMSTGDYIALFDHDDLLHPAALHQVMKAICEKDADFIYTDENTFHERPEDAYCPHFKPDFAPDTLRANNYICHFTVFSRDLLQQTGGFREECDGSQDYDMVLRLTEKAEHVVHVPQILYYWRAHAGSVADSVGAKPYVIEAAHRALCDHLKRVGLKGEVLNTVVPSMYRIRYELERTPLVSILLPNYEHLDDLRKCLDSVFAITTYPNFEIIIIENNSTSQELFDYYNHLKQTRTDVKVVCWKGQFNYSAINNFGARFAKGEYLLLLNNDTEVLSPDWIQEMLMFAQRKDVGAVGAKLYYPDDTIQHAGIGIGLLTLAGHFHRGFDRDHPGYMGRLIYAQDLSAVTGACMMIRRDVWDQVGGLDESFAVAFNDVDLCMRIRKAGHLIVWTPYAELYHYESKSRGVEDTPEKKERFAGEVMRFQKRWAAELAAGDPYYNPNLTLDREDFSLR